MPRKSSEALWWNMQRSSVHIVRVMLERGLVVGACYGFVKGREWRRRKRRRKAAHPPGSALGKQMHRRPRLKPECQGHCELDVTFIPGSVWKAEATVCTFKEQRNKMLLTN